MLVIAAMMPPRPAGAGVPAADQDRARKLAREGNALLVAERFGEAVAKYKQAERIWSRLVHACNIGLAYSKAKRYARAHLFLGLCRERAEREGKRGKLAAWVVERHRAAGEAMARGNYGRITIDMREVPGARVAASAFGPDETFTAPRTVWLPAGLTTLTLIGRDGKRSSRQVRVEPNASRTIALAFPRTVIDPPPRIAWVLVSAGALALAGGGVFHLSAREASRDAEALPPVPAGTPYPEFTAKQRLFERNRTLALISYAAGGLAAAVGLGLLIKGGSERQVSVAVDGERAAVGVAWSF